MLAEIEDNIREKKILDAGDTLGKYFLGIMEGIVRAFVTLILYSIAALLRGLDKLKRLFAKLFGKLAAVFSAPINRYKMAIRLSRNNIRRKSEDEGTAAGFAAGLRTAGRLLFGKRGIFVTIFNYALPVLSCVFLFNIIAYASSQTYALKLSVNGEFIGYISDEAVYTNAEQMVQKRINYTGASTDVVTFSPAYEVEMVGYSTMLSPYQLTDRMLQLLDKKIEYGYGLYIGDTYFGTLIEKTKVEEALDGLLDKYRTNNPKETVAFEKEITFTPGLYLSESFVNEDYIIHELTGNKTNAAYYTVVDGDAPSLICSKVDMTYEELEKLNPGFGPDYAVWVGDQIKILQDVPFLNVVITREEHYTESVDYTIEYVDDSTRYSDDKVITQNGEEGERSVVANVSYINGVEVSRKVLSRTTIKSPVKEIIAIGTKPRPVDASTETITEAGKFIWPVGGSSYTGYGWGGYPGHRGQDIIAAYGSPIYAADSGTVIGIDYGGAWFYNGGYGNLVKIQHANGTVTYYAHCSAIADIYVGQQVTAGQVIAYVGATGEASCNHLHFEVHIGGVKVDPAPYLPYHY